MLKMLANNRYLNWAETYYKICYLLFAPNVLLFRKIGGTPFAKSKIQRMSSNFVHFYVTNFRANFTKAEILGYTSALQSRATWKTFPI